MSPSPRPGSQTELLPPSPLGTARTGFPISSSSLSNARCWTQLIHRHTQAMNFVMALWMEQQSVTQPIAATIDPPHNVMAMPSRQFGDLLLTNWAEPALLPPKIKQLSPAFKIVGHFQSQPMLKVRFPLRVIWVCFTFDFDVALDRDVGRGE